MSLAMATQCADYGMPIYDSDDKDAMASIQDTHTHTYAWLMRRGSPAKCKKRKLMEN